MELTRLLESAQAGDAAARDQVFQLTYDELHALAHAQLRRRAGGRDQTLNTTALIHEAYIKLGADGLKNVTERAHFYSLAARAMRQVIVSYFRRRQAEKRGAGEHPLQLAEDQVPGEQRSDTLLAIDEALHGLSAMDPRLASIVEWRFFCGLRETEIAELLGVSDRTVRTEWRKAKAWLGKALEGA